MSLVLPFILVTAVSTWPIEHDTCRRAPGQGLQYCPPAVIG
jgi:hypothetical protein